MPWQPTQSDSEGHSHLSTAEPASSSSQNGSQVAKDGSTEHDPACWAFSSKYIKTTKAALKTALDAILVSPWSSLLIYIVNANDNADANAVAKANADANAT